MGVIKRLFGRTKLYRALDYALEEYGNQERLNPAAEEFAHIGENTVVQKRAFITHPSRVWLGRGSTIQNGTFINSMGGLHIGDYVGVGYRSLILTWNHTYRNAGHIPFDAGIMLQPVIIRDFVWIGWGSVIMPGVELGEGSVVAMGSVVTKSVAPLAIVLGNPAEVIGHRSAAHFESCKREGRVSTHRILEQFGGFEEKIPLMTRKRYEKELRDMGLI